MQSANTILVPVGGNKVERLVALAALELHHWDSRFLCEVGKYEEGKVAPRCQLPACMQHDEELPVAALQRLLTGEMSPFAEGLEFQGSKSDVHWNRSTRYRIDSRYLRTVFEANLEETFEMPTISEIEFN